MMLTLLAANADARRELTEAVRAWLRAREA